MMMTITNTEFLWKVVLFLEYVMVGGFAVGWLYIFILLLLIFKSASIPRALNFLGRSRSVLLTVVSFMDNFEALAAAN